MTDWTTIVAGLALGLVACSGKVGGDTGSESHWLKSCTNDGECQRGSCLCGRCTLECTQDSDCRWPLDVCVSPGDEPSLECASPPRGLCGVSGADGTSSLSHALVVERQQCAGERKVRLVSIPEAAVAPPFLVDLSGDEFTFVGAPGRQDVSRQTLGGELIHTYTVSTEVAEPSSLSIDDAVFHPEGAITLVGSVSGGPVEGYASWIGALDVEGQLLWERILDAEELQNLIGLEPLSDGGYIYARVLVARVIPTGPAERVTAWSRLDDEGVELWKKTVPLVPDGQGYYGSALAKPYNQTVQLVTGVTDGVFIVTSDLDGNYSGYLHEDATYRMISGVATLPDGFVAYLSGEPKPGVTMIRPDGSVAWQKSYEKRGYYDSVLLMYHAAYDELLLFGDDDYVGPDYVNKQFYVVGLDVLGNKRWEVRGDLIDDPNAPLVYALLPTEGGRLIGLRNIPPLWPEFSYYVVDPPACP